MNEIAVIDQLKSCGIDVVLSLPCDKNKAFTSELYNYFSVVDLTREEDGVGISAGLALTKRKFVMSIQSSGIGNMVNAMLSLTRVYSLPLPILASWRGVQNESIEAQVPFNSRILGLLDNYDIGYTIITDEADIPKIADAISEAYANNEIHVILIKPGLWGASADTNIDYPERKASMSLNISREYPQPVMKRLDAIRCLMSNIDDDTAVVSNIGVPSKEVYAVMDRSLNFYMLGSYTQATPIGIGIALGTDRHVCVIDGDGSLLGSSVLPVLASLNLKNLTIMCLDNGTFGSTGNQMNQAYSVSNIEFMARACGIADTVSASTENEIDDVMKEYHEFIHIRIAPGNSLSKNLLLSASDIKERFMSSIIR